MSAFRLIRSALPPEADVNAQGAGRQSHALLFLTQLEVLSDKISAKSLSRNWAMRDRRLGPTDCSSRCHAQPSSFRLLVVATRTHPCRSA